MVVARLRMGSWIRLFFQNELQTVGAAEEEGAGAGEQHRGVEEEDGGTVAHDPNEGTVREAG